MPVVYLSSDPSLTDLPDPATWALPPGGNVTFGGATVVSVKVSGDMLARFGPVGAGIDSFAQQPHVLVGTLKLPRVTVQAAVDALNAAKGNGVRRPLAKVHPDLVDLDLDALAAAEFALDATLTGPVKKKTAVIRRLTKILAGATSPFTRDERGHCVPITGPADQPRPAGHAETQAAVRRVAAAYGNGHIIGRGITTAPEAVMADWLSAWHAGDLKAAYELEAAHTPNPSPHHPGAPANPGTHHVVWAPACAGELPAGQIPDGDWPSPNTMWNLGEADAYVVAARCSHPTRMSAGQRIRWAKGHLRGDARLVDWMSIRARDRPAEYAAPAVQPLPAPAKWADLLTGGVPTGMWNVTALRAYAAANGVKHRNTYRSLLAAVEPLVDTYRQRREAEQMELALRVDTDQPTLSGYHRKSVLRDQFDRRWLFKPAPGPDSRFRADVEHAAHVLARRWGYPTASSALTTFDGQYGQLQAMLPVARNLLGATAADLAALTREQLCAIAREHVLDWALDNDDSHAENIVVLTTGAVVGIDKGRAWRYFGGWPGLTGDRRADTNCHLIYTQLYAAIIDGQISTADTDAMYRAVIRRATTMQRLPDADLRAIMTTALEHRPHYAPSSYQSPVAGAPTSADELITQAIARKNNLVADMSALWAGIYTRLGRDLPGPATSLGDNPQGHPLYAGLHDPELHHAITLTKSFGTATFVAGTGVEDGCVLLWRERRQDGRFNIRGQFKARASSYLRLSQTLKDMHANGSPWLRKLPATRAAATWDTAGPRRDADGELQLNGYALEGDPMPGYMYLCTLPTGEEIEYRDQATQTPLSSQGLVQFTVAPTVDLATGLRHITDTLAQLGCPLEPATPTDLELFYWRHLAGVMMDRRDSRPGGKDRRDRPVTFYHAFWATRPTETGDPAEVDAWRAAYATIVGRSTVDTFVATGGYLPHFMHQDLRRPDQPCGRPYWNRIDVPPARVRMTPPAAIQYRSGPRYVVGTGVAMATEARVRTWAVWKGGMSSLEDMNCGSAGFIFARLDATQDMNSQANVIIAAHALARTSTYSFNGDFYGKISARHEASYFDFATLTRWGAESNEVLFKDTLSLLDDIELCVFNRADNRATAIRALAELGITEIRGVPVSTRFITCDSIPGRRTALKTVLAGSHQPC